MEDFGLPNTRFIKIITVQLIIYQSKTGDLQSVKIAKTITAFTSTIEKSPDLVVIHGDRLEALACAIAAGTNYIKVLHVEEESVWEYDEIGRHAISKFSNFHCVSSKEAKDRLIRMGESESIYDIGSPELDLHEKCDPSMLPGQGVLWH